MCGLLFQNVHFLVRFWNESPQLLIFLIIFALKILTIWVEKN